MARHILIIEDDNSLRNLYGLYLERANYAHIAVSSVPDAVDVLAEMPIDAALVDINLGDALTGLKFIEYVRSNPDYDHIKLITLTSFPQPFDRIHPGWIDLALNKPVKFQQLAMALDSLFDE